MCLCCANVKHREPDWNIHARSVAQCDHGPSRRVLICLGCILGYKPSRGSLNSRNRILILCRSWNRHAHTTWRWSCFRRATAHTMSSLWLSMRRCCVLSKHVCCLLWNNTNDTVFRPEMSLPWQQSRCCALKSHHTCKCSRNWRMRKWWPAFEMLNMLLQFWEILGCQLWHTWYIWWRLLLHKQSHYHVYQVNKTLFWACFVHIYVLIRRIDCRLWGHLKSGRWLSHLGYI